MTSQRLLTEQNLQLDLLGIGFINPRLARFDTFNATEIRDASQALNGSLSGDLSSFKNLNLFLVMSVLIPNFCKFSIIRQNEKFYGLI